MVETLLNLETVPRPKIKDLEVIVAEGVRESPEAAALGLFTGEDRSITGPAIS